MIEKVGARLLTEFSERREKESDQLRVDVRWYLYLQDHVGVSC